MPPPQALQSLLLLAALVLGFATPAAASDRPNILLITLETTRPDHLGVYGYEKQTSPALDRLAQDSLVFDRAFSTSSWTLPAHASLFTGLFPTTHGARYDEAGPLVLSDGIRGKQVLSKFRATPLADGEPVLAELLAAQGYDTGAVVAGPWMKQIFGLGRGFSHYDDAGITDLYGRLAADVTREATAWIDQRADAASKPFFLFLNYYDPHGPYTDPAGYARQFLPPGTIVFPQPRERSPEFLSGVYDGEIRYMDEHLGALFERLRELALYDDMWIVVTADHGELFGEHGKEGHGSSLWEEELRIPLIVKFPKATKRSGRSSAPVQLTDLLPMLLEALGTPVPERVQGGVPPDVGHPIYAEVYPLIGAAPVLDWRVLVDGDFKYVWTSDERGRLFDIAKDAGEQSDLAGEQAERALRLSTEMRRFVSELPVARRPDDTPVRQVDEETRRALEGLGYLE